MTADHDIWRLKQKAKKRLIIVGGFPPHGADLYGGIVTACQILSQSSLFQKFEIQVVDSTQREHPLPSLKRRALATIPRMATFISKLARFRPHAVILFCSLSASAIEKGAMAWLAKVFGAKILFFPRGFQLTEEYETSFIARTLLKISFYPSDAFLCQGEAWQRFAVDKLKIDKSRAPVIYNWTATPDLLEVGRKKAKNINFTSVPQIFFLGWLEKEKGILELLRAVERLHVTQKFKLTIGGAGNAERAVRFFLQDKGLQDVVEIKGWMNFAEKAELYAQADILVLPSWHEGFPNVLIEAMATNTAVLATSVGNIPDVLTDGENCILVPPKSVEDLVTALERLLVDPEARRGIAFRGFSFAQENFTVDTAVSQISNIVNLCTFDRKA